MSKKYFAVWYKSGAIAVLEQRSAGDSIGCDAKETVMLNRITFGQVHENNVDVICRHHDIQIVAASNFNSFLTEKQIVPY